MDACMNEVITASGVDADDAAEILELIGDERARLEAEGAIDDIDRRLQAWAKGFVADLDGATLARDRRVKQNIILREKLDTHLDQLQAEGVKGYAARLNAFLYGTHRGAKGGRVSVAARRADLEQRWAGQILAAIEGERPHLIKMMRDKKEGPQLMDDVVREMFAKDKPARLRKEGEPFQPAPRATQNSDAQFLADLLARVSDSSRERLNLSGAMVRHLKGWVPQRHDIIAMHKAGREEWKQFLLENGLVDVKRTFQKEGMPPEAISQGLDGIYDSLLFGSPTEKFANWADMRLSGPANLADQLGRKHRVLFFTDADAWLRYSERFGAGNVMDTVLAHLRDTATHAACLETMGTNPQAFMENYLTRLQDRVRMDETLSDEVKKKELHRLPRDLNGVNNSVQRAFAMVTGNADRPENITWARIGSFARGWTSLAKLGMATLSSVTDLATAASRLRHEGVPLLEGYRGMLAGLFEGKMDSEKKELAYLLGVGFDGLLGDIHARWMAEDTPHGMMSKAQTTFFRLSGMTAWTERNRATFGLMSSANMALQSRKGWGELPAGYKHNLELHGIGEREWAIVQAMDKRAVGKKDGAGGTDYVVPESVRSLPDEVIDAYIAPELQKAKALLSERHGELVKAQAEKAQAALKGDPHEELSRRLKRYFETKGEGAMTPEELGLALAGDVQKLSDAALDRLEKSGIHPDAWDKLRSLVWKRQDGTLYLNVDAVQSLRPRQAKEILAAAADAMGGRAEGQAKREIASSLAERRSRLRRQARADLEDKLAAYFIDETDYGVIRPDERTRVWQTAGAKPGTILGEAARFMMQFKSFPIAFSQRVLGTHLWGGPGCARDAGGLGHLIASCTMLGYLAMSAKDVFKGREPRDPSKAATWLAAFMQGGGAGIYGDFLLSKYSRFGDSPMNTLTGPFPNVADDVIKLAVNSLHGEFDAGDAIYTSINNTPFVNLFYTRQALDWLVIYHLQELASPGYLRRTQRRLKKEYNQEFIVPPAAHISRGGGWK